MAMGRQVAFIEARLADLPSETIEAAQRVLYRACTAVKLGAAAMLDRDPSRSLFHAWQEVGPLLAYPPEDGEWQAVLAMRDLLGDFYPTSHALWAH